MSAQHFRSLLFKSAQIQEQIDKEHKQRWPNWMRLLRLKKLRLKIKDRMAKMMRAGVAEVRARNFAAIQAKSARYRHVES